MESRIHLYWDDDDHDDDLVVVLVAVVIIAMSRLLWDECSRSEWVR